VHVQSSTAPTVSPACFPEMNVIKIIEKSGEEKKKFIRQVKALLIVVNDNEFRAVIGLMESMTGTKNEIIEVVEEDVIFKIGKYGQFVSAMVQTSAGGAGVIGADQMTARAIKVVNPCIVIGVGVCFGKDGKSQQLGDVIVAKKVSDYTCQRIGAEETIPRDAHPPASSHLHDIFRNKAGWSLKRAPGNLCNVIVAPLISGPNLIDNLEEKKKLFDLFKDAKGGDMEGAAILSAIHGLKGTKPEGIIVKAICDWGDGKKMKDWQPFAAHAAASYVLHHLDKRGTYDRFA